MVEEGMSENMFSVSDPKLASIAIYNLLMGIAVWYTEDGRLGVDELKEEYIRLVENMLGVKPSFVH